MISTTGTIPVSPPTSVAYVMEVDPSNAIRELHENDNVRIEDVTYRAEPDG